MDKIEVTTVYRILHTGYGLTIDGEWETRREAESYLDRHVSKINTIGIATGITGTWVVIPVSVIKNTFYRFEAN